MKLVRFNADLLKYRWQCTFCKINLKLTKCTPVSGLNLKVFDTCLELWLAGSTGKLAERLVYSIYGGKGIFKIFRKMCSHYYATRIKKYLVLPGPVEIDEAQVGAKRFWLFTNRWPECRWIFGMACRLTKMTCLYHIPDKRHCNLTNFMKRHIPPGTILMSDEHSSYV